MTDAATLRDLIADVERAECGSRELDARIARWLGWRENRNIPNVWIDPTFAGLRDLHHFTTSLDAKLPGEEIIATERDQYGSGRWWAKAACPDGCEPDAVAQTEPLARRAAALRALLHEMENADA